MKKFISILLLIVMVFSISACNKSNNTSSELDAGPQSDVSIVDTISQNNTTSNEDLKSGQSSSKEESKPQSSSESSSKAEVSKTIENTPTVVAGEYTVTFDYGYDNKKITAKSKNYKVAKPDNPTRTGYEFCGWYVDDERWNFVGHAVTTDITLTAKWSEICTNAGSQSNGVKPESYNDTGLLIMTISEDSNLYGKTQSGDIITQVNGIDINDDNILIDIIKERKAGDKILLTIINDNGTKKTIEVELIANIDDPSSARLGITYTVVGSSQTDDGIFDFPFGE